MTKVSKVYLALKDRGARAFSIDPAWAPLDSERDNRSLGIAETSLLRKLNRRLELGVTREAQDALAAASHHNLAASYESGFQDDLVTPFLGLDRDQNLRPDSSMEKLASLKPVFGSALPDGSYGGNPCGFHVTTKSGKKIYDAIRAGGRTTNVRRPVGRDRGRRPTFRCVARRR